MSDDQWPKFASDKGGERSNLERSGTSYKTMIPILEPHDTSAIKRQIAATVAADPTLTPEFKAALARIMGKEPPQ